MEVILREDVPHLGTIGDIVKVRPGYARNYLLPRGLATVADKRNLRVLEHDKRIVEDKRKRAMSAAEQLAKKLGGTTVTIPARAGEEPHAAALCFGAAETDRSRHGQRRGPVRPLRPVRRALPDGGVGHAEVLCPLAPR